jgi:hypothetical protein
VRNRGSATEAAAVAHPSTSGAAEGAAGVRSPARAVAQTFDSAAAVEAEHPSHVAEAAESTIARA